MSDKNEVTYRAVKALGGQIKTAALVGLTQQSVSVWVKAGRLPAEHVLTIEAALHKQGIGIDRHNLRPDVFGPSPELIKSA